MTFRKQNGFSIIELVVTMAAFSIFFGYISINLITAKQKSDLSSTVTLLVSDLKHQQINAISQDSAGLSTLSDYGVYFQTYSYTLFRGSSYSPSNSTNFPVNLGDKIQFAGNTFPDQQIIFHKGSGETAGEGNLIIRNIQDGESKTVTVNRYGVITGIN